MTDYTRQMQAQENSYSRRMREERAAEIVPEEDNPYLRRMREEQAFEQNRLRTVLEMAVKEDPDIAAERLRLSQASGLPPDVVKRNLETIRVKEQARMVDLARMASESPVLYRQLVDPNFTSTAVDDLGTLQKLEHSVQRGVRYVMGAQPDGGLVGDLPKIATDVGLAATAGVGEMIFNVAGAVSDVVGWRSGARGYREQAERSRLARQDYGLQPTTSTGEAVKSGLQSAGTNLALLPLGLARGLFATANQAAAAVSGVMATGVGAEAYLRAREQGKSEIGALAFGIPQGAFEYLFEKIPASKLFGDIAANTGLMKTLGKQAFSEGWTEQLTTLAQDFNEWVNLNPNKTLAEFINERPEAAYQTFIATLVGVGVQTSTIKGINKIIETASNRALVFEQDLLQQQMALAAQSTLRQRSPEQFRAHVQRVVDSDEGAKKEIYVDAEVLNQLPQEIMAQLPESVREALPAALETNSTVAIPMADVLTVAPGTELEQILNDNARLRPNAASRAEAQLAEQFLRQDAERVLKQAADQTAWQQSSLAVKQAILDQLNSTKRFTPDVNESYATLQMNFFSTMAARVGLTPQEFYNRYMLKVGARGMPGDVLNKEAMKPGELTVEGFHYSKEARPTVNTAMFGTGLQGSNRDLYLNAEDQRLRKRAYFYVDKGTGINPEAGVGGIAQKATLTNIYDADADPLRLKKGGQLAFESAVLDAGFSGYLTRMEGGQSGQVIMLGDQTIATELIGPSGKLQGQRVPAPQARQALGRDAVVDALKANKNLPSGEMSREMWGRMVKALAPAQYDAMAAAGVFEGEGQFYKDGLIRDFESRTEAPVYNQSATLRRGTETLKKYGLKPGGKYKTREVAAALEARQRAKYGTIAPDDRSPEAIANIAKWMTAEVEFEMDNPEKSGVGWYSEKFQRALDVMGSVFPELKTDKKARDTMTALIAITSDGQKVVPNFAQAMDIYGNFRESGKFTTSRGHARQASIAKNLEVIQRLHDQMGPEAMHEYLMQEKTISELKKLAKQNGGELKSDYQAHIKMPMAAVEFGPKLGAFYANLMGAHGYLTMDRWWSRTFNRYRGTLLQSNTQSALDTFKSLIAKPELSNDEVLAAVVAPREALEARGFKTRLAVLVGKSEPGKAKEKAAWMTKAREFAGDQFDALLSEHNIERAANTIYKTAFENLEDAPFNATDRTFMLDAVNRAQQTLKRKGYNLSVADIQAILWYYEKRLYGELGARQTADISYEEAAQRVASSYASGQGIESLLDDTGAAPEDGGTDEDRVSVGEDDFVEGGLDGEFEQAGDRGGRRPGAGPAPLPGAPVIEGATGPDPRLVSVAEQYARDNGIDLKRQSEYATVDPERAARIAQAYEEMQHAPNDPAVQEAYQNLIQQTVAQYRALEAAGYRFWFVDPTNDPYKSPWDAMREMRASQTMGVFPTVAGFGSGATDVDISDNPLMADTGIVWPYGSLDGELKPVLANDLFRAVHDAFGHGLEGAGFRAQGEENAWQAHIRLFTGSAKGAITSETRGQNSWLNFGPYGERNRNAKVEDTVFADQKTGLMPEWTWAEGLVPDMQEQPLEQSEQSVTLKLYHGTNKEFDTFDTGRFGARDPGFYGEGMYLTPDRDEAADYADSAVEDAGEGEPVVLERDVTLRNPFIWDMSDEGSASTREALASFGIKRDSVRGNSNALGNRDERARFNRAVRAAGHDGVIVRDEDGVREVVVFNPDTNDASTLSQGPRGTFSPEQLLITLNENADLSTFLHESGHFFLEVMADLASQPNAPQQIKDDMATTLAWFGVPDLATWNGYTLNEKRPYHERWAESFEQYLFEGKAPSVELQPLFRRFRSWLLNVYKSLTQFMRERNLQLGDDIRQVFGRMLAVDEQIAQAEEAAGLLPDFDATNEAIEKLQARSLRDLKWAVNARNKRIKELQKQAKDLRKEVEAEVRAEVEQMPEVRAKRALDALQVTPEYQGVLDKYKEVRAAAEAATKEEITSQLIAAEEATNGELKGLKKGQFLAKQKRTINNLVEARMIEWDRANPKPPRPVNATDLDMAIVADSFGYQTVEQMMQAIDAFGRVEDAVEGMTDQRMLERHGDLVDQRAIEEAANEAVHNEARARSLATELRTQSEMMSQRQDTGRTDVQGRPITVNAITAAAKEFALNLAARRRIKDLKNATWQHRSAEARAGKAWQNATAKGETEAAVQAKRDQVLNNAAVAALQDAQVEVRKTLEFFKRVVKGSDEKLVERGRDPDVVNAMRAILAAYGVAPRLEKSALDYLEVVSRNDPAMYGVLKPIVDAALIEAVPLPEMTVEQLRGLTDNLRAMWELAKRSRQMEVDGNLLDLEDASAELFARMEQIGIPTEVPGEKGAITEKQERGLKLQFAKSILRRVEQWAEGLDGKFGGPFLRLVFQPVKDAADRYRTARTDYRKRFTDLVQNLAPAMPAGAIDAPEIGYIFGNARDSGTAELVHAILHTGNDSNKRKLLLGRGWATENADGTLDTRRWDAFLQRAHNTGILNKAHWDFAQGVWDLLEETKPLAQQTHRQVFGRYFAEVTANPVVTPFGTYSGGYVPAQTDSRLVKDAKLRELAEGENESMAYAFPSAPSGFTKARVEYNKPLLLDLRALAQHIDKVLLFSHMQVAINDVRRLLSRKDVSYALDRIDPGAYEGMLIPWLNRSAKQIVETPVVGDRKLSRFLSAARSRAGMALMFANLSNTVQQITGFSLAAVKVKPGLMLQATGQFAANPKAFKQSVADASPYMKERMLNDMSAMNDAVEEILVDQTLLERGQAWTQRHAYFLQSAVDNTMSPIIWTAAYNQAIAEGQNARDAVRFADGVIRQTQGSLLPEDVSRFETGPAYGRLFTQFVSYFNMMANTNGTAVKQIVEEMGVRKGAGKILYVALAGLLVPIWVAEAIAQAFRGGPEDDEGDGYLDDWLAAVFGFGTIKGLSAQVPVIGQAGQLVINRFNDNPADDKFSLSPAVSLIESSVSAPASVYKAIVDDGNAQKAVRDVAAAATLITGLPIYAAARPVGYLAGMADEKIRPAGPVDLTRGLVTGTASQESKAP